MLIHSANQVLLITKTPQRGNQIGELGIIEDGAVYIDNGIVVETGYSKQLLNKYSDTEKFDASGKVVMPGFVDAHTHVIWAGDRALEFEMKLEGKTYLEILNSGGGILSTVSATRKASLEELLDQTRPRLKKMFMHGATTIEAKTGYGLDLETELKLLEGLTILDEEGPWDLAITFLGAHAVPEEYKSDPDGFTKYVCNEMLPEVDKWWKAKYKTRHLPFVDVFCETGAFNLEQSLQILESAKQFGFPLKIHADEFDNLGGTEMAVNLQAFSSDHLIAVSDADVKALGAGDTVAVALPGTPFGLAEDKFAPAKKLLDHGAILALGSDLNPGTSWCENMQMALALSCRFMRLTPAQAIVASTINSAASIGKENEIGSLNPGKKADILVMDVPDYRHLGYRYGVNLVDSVIKKGILYNSL